MKKIGGYFLAALGVLLAAGAGGWYWYYSDAINLHSQSFAEKQELLTPYFQVFLPEAEGPHPALVFMHGCGGLGDYNAPRAESAAEQGYVVIMVDSHTPRSIDWRRNCGGRVLQGPERAADTLVALEYARQHPAVDPEQLFLVGFSHGGWTILEGLNQGDALPPGLLDSPGNHMNGVRGLIAWYPYCGFAAEFTSGWDSEIPVLMLLAEEDTTTDPLPCAEIAQRNAAQGKPVEYVIYEDVGHGFDVQADWVPVYDPETHARALREQFTFIAELSGR
jgi:dienelactone hydrolase